ncbi:hypothetical protein B0A48_02674 [Cryoendolithus antarcticus]|uniref:DC-UbP/UBTD2 N-terminal domain-containing protein n=1 Tax=Cryoendolithus antarcticus TaxID=1507870 RepID=A0A1V8TKZ6_9PEZI|nr:hypothetical protein B0A48_02674 [Cryoendolithus antarcticus]
MGCCNSTPSPSSDDGPPNPPASQAVRRQNLPHDSSRAAINQPALTISGATSPRGSSLSHAPPATSAAARPNAPLRAPSPVPASPAHVPSRPPPWTREVLEAERAAFFDTRVTGREEVWGALKVVCDLLRRGEVAEAQGIVDAVGISCPTGRVASGRGRDRVKGGVYDERGEVYDIPAWVILDPEDIADEGAVGDSGEEKEAVAGAGAVDGAVDDDEKEGEGAEGLERQRSDKGKGREEDVGEIFKLRARRSDRGTDVVVQVGTKEKVSVIVRRILEQIGPKRVRLAYLGHVMQEGKTLEEQGFRVGDVVNAYVFEGDEKHLTKRKAPIETRRSLAIVGQASSVFLDSAIVDEVPGKVWSNMEELGATSYLDQGEDTIERKGSMHTIGWEDTNIARNRFKQSEYLHSYRRLKLAFEAGYEAVDRLDAAIAGDRGSVEFIEGLVAKAPAKVKEPKSRPSDVREIRPVAALSAKPKINLFERPLPLEKLSGRRHVPVLFSAGTIPVLRFGKPQPPVLSGFLKHRIRQRQQRWNRRHALSDQIGFAEHEDRWDDILAGQIGQRRHRESSWSDEPRQARREVDAKLRDEGRKNVEMAEQMQAVVDREQALLEKEGANRRQKRQKEQVAIKKVNFPQNTTPEDDKIDCMTYFESCSRKPFHGALRGSGLHVRALECLIASFEQPDVYLPRDYIALQVSTLVGKVAGRYEEISGFDGELGLEDEDVDMRDYTELLDHRLAKMEEFGAAARRRR